MAEGAQLTKWSRDLNIKDFLKKKENRKAARVAAHTSRLALQEKREHLQGKSNQINGLVNQVLDAVQKPPKVEGRTEEEKRELIAEWTKGMGDRVNMANVIGVSGYLDAQGMIFDALTTQEPCDVVDEKTGKTKPGHRRRSANEALWDIADYMQGIFSLTLIQTRMMNDDLMCKVEGIPLRQRWQDENHVPINPYFRDIEEEAGEILPDPKDAESDKIKAADAAQEGVSTVAPVKEELVDMDKIKEFVNKNGEAKKE